MKNILLYLLCILHFTTCIPENTAKSEQKELLSNTQKIQLDQEQIFLKIPTSFKRSSRYRLEEDLPSKAADTIGLWILQNQLESLEFKDAEIDVFVDTTFDFHYFVILNTRHMPFTDKEATYINGIIGNYTRSLDANILTIEIEKLDSSIRKGKDWKYMKFKHFVKNLELPDESFYRSTYFLTTNIQTLIIYEFSNKEKDIEKYLWTIKD